MRIPRVHVDQPLAIGAEVELGADRSHYLKHVLRLKSGAPVRLFNGADAVDYPATITLAGKTLVLRVDSVVPAAAESPLHSQLIAGLAKSDHVDWSLQKTTEIGINRIVLFNAARSQSALKGARLERKLEHWRGVVTSACEQSGRARLPALEFHSDLRGALGATIPGHRILLDPAGVALPSLLQSAAGGIALLLGPEGGLDDAEIRLARDAGYASASLGPRVLRTETAAAAALALAQACLGDMG